MSPLAALLAFTLTVDAPPSLGYAANRLRGVDRERLAAALRGAGLRPPGEVEVMLVVDRDPRFQDAPRWMVGRAFGFRHVVIFPERITRYPYDSLESVLRHEVVHLALTSAAAGRPLPRWFHEGVATSVESGWNTLDRVRLLVSALSEPTVADVGALFGADTQPEAERAYLLAAALVHDLRERHGSDVAGRIAARVAAGAAFPQAFMLETGESPEAAAAVAWRSYRRWSRWLPALASASTMWNLILAVALVAFLVRLRRRARQRRAWSNEDGA